MKTKRLCQSQTSRKRQSTANAFGYQPPAVNRNELTIKQPSNCCGTATAISQLPTKEVFNRHYLTRRKQRPYAINHLDVNLNTVSRHVL
jgi:hypothetical protein